MAVAVVAVFVTCFAGWVDIVDVFVDLAGTAFVIAVAVVVEVVAVDGAGTIGTIEAETRLVPVFFDGKFEA